MRRFLKGIATFASAAMMIGAPVVANAAGNIDANEQSVLEWIKRNAEGGESSAAYAVAKEQFEYTTNKMSAEQVTVIKENIKAAKDLNDIGENTAANQAQMLTYISKAAEAAGGKAIAVTNPKSLESSVAFVRVDESDPNVILKMQVAVDAQDGAAVKDYVPAGDKVSVGGETYYKDANGNYQKAVDVAVSYACHIQTYGDKQGAVKNGALAGTIGESKRLEAIKIDVTGNDNLGITYTTHCQTYGWLPWSSNGEQNGTTGEAKRLEAIKIKLTGSAANLYDVYYRGHAQSYGWLNWAKNGESAGTAGYAKRLEGIQVVIVPKGKAFDANAYVYKSTNANAFVSTGKTTEAPETAVPTVMYKTHVQTFGWQNWVINGKASGTSGQAKRLEGINIKLTNKDCAGSIVYSTHVQSYGWQAPVSDGVMSGTSGQAKRLEAIKIDLTGEMKAKYDVYYRVHVQSYGWMDWAKNGEPAGTVGQSKRLEAIQIVLVPKGQGAPAATYEGVTTTVKQAYIQK